MPTPTETKLRKEQHKQSKARREAETRKEAAHSNPEDLQCSKCDRRFKKAARCAIHVPWCTNDRKCAQCPIDNTRYPTDRALHRHWNIYHNPGCSFCKAKISLQDRDQHERESHPIEYQAREYQRQHFREFKKCSFCRVIMFPQDIEKHERERHRSAFYERLRFCERERCSFCKKKFYPEDREDHERDSHPDKFHDPEYEPEYHIRQKCSFCEARFFPNARWKHERDSHPQEFNDRENKRKRGSPSWEPANEPASLPSTTPDHYKTLGVARDASAEEIERVAKMMRILCHPDRLKRNGPTPEEIIQIDEKAKNVGWAADVLCDEMSRQKYDQELDLELH